MNFLMNSCAMLSDKSLEKLANSVSNMKNLKSLRLNFDKYLP